ncbi:SdpI family protein [Vallitalea maricola]|uniref:SdpI family protein n=1 Tax=Vallitalea maricola TaxID=3074433 RepID=A0ACB5UIF8_9FIRM|nr:SdpI family protein [Vallitalea sp. AN17-2]
MKKPKLTLILCIISFIGTCIAYFYLPDIIPIHWGINGEVDNYGPKYMAIILSAIPLAIYLLMNTLPKIDPKKENYKKHSKAYNIFSFYTILFLIIINWITIIASFGVKIDVGLLIPILVGILFIIIGNYMPQFRHNYFIGIKTPWTLTDETNWKKTHFYGGYVFMILGIIIILMGIISNPLIVYIGLAVSAILFISLFVYSYLLYKNKYASKK